MQGSVNLKLFELEVYNGKRNFLTVNTQLFTVDQYLELSKLQNPEEPISSKNKSLFAAFFLSITSAKLWFSLVSSGVAPTA